MATFTSTLPDKLLKSLAEKAQSLSIPKNKLIENALRIYLEHLDKAEYIKSYKQAASDKEILSIAEEGMEDYFKQIRVCRSQSDKRKRAVGVEANCNY